MSKRSAKEGARGMFMLQPGRLQRTVEPEAWNQAVRNIPFKKIEPLK